MILIADSGSTKTSWAVTGPELHQRIIQTQGLNPYFTSPGQIHEVLRDELIPFLDPTPVTGIFFYGAGCSTELNNRLVASQLSNFFPVAGIHIYHDILGAARALFGSNPGIACILGTGSNSSYYDGKEIFSDIPSLGYLFGDEGAGSSLGKKLLEKYLRKEFSGSLLDAFDQSYGLSLEEILNSLYNKPFPNRYLASFSPFLLAHKEKPEIHDLIFSSFTEFMDRHVTRYSRYLSVPAGFLGSIAYHYRDILYEAAAVRSVIISSILPSPMEGLLAFHGIRNST